MFATLNPTKVEKAAQRKAMRYSLSAVSGLLVLFGCTTTQQPTAYRQGDAYPTEQGVVCAVKAGDRQNYWNERAAQLNGALVIFRGECPAEPNTEGFSMG
jgi:hypothetical protein